MSRRKPRLQAGNRRKNRRGFCESCLQRFGFKAAIEPGTQCEFEGNPVCDRCGEPHAPGKYEGDEWHR